MAFDLQIQPRRHFGGDHHRGVAVIDRLQKAALGGAAFEPGAAPALHRQVRHIGIDIHTRDETAPEPEPLGDRVVMDPILGFFRRVESLDAVRAQIRFSMRFGHGSGSSGRL